jgi:hypothetical protein
MHSLIKIYSSLLVITFGHQSCLVTNYISRLIKFILKDPLCSKNRVTFGPKEWFSNFACLKLIEFLLHYEYPILVFQGLLTNVRLKMRDENNIIDMFHYERYSLNTFRNVNNNDILSLSSHFIEIRISREART